MAAPPAAHPRLAGAASSFVAGWMDGERGWDLAVDVGIGAAIGGALPDSVQRWDRGSRAPAALLPAKPADSSAAQEEQPAPSAEVRRTSVGAFVGRLGTSSESPWS